MTRDQYEYVGRHAHMLDCLVNPARTLSPEMRGAMTRFEAHCDTRTLERLRALARIIADDARNGR